MAPSANQIGFNWSPLGYMTELIGATRKTEERVTLTENECNNMYQNNKTGTSLSVCIHIYTERERDDWHSLSLSMYIYTHSQREVLYIQSEREGARVDNL